MSKTCACIPPMRVFDAISEAKAHLRPLQGAGLRIALVPTMGALHEGHLSLIQIARSRAEVVVATVFVNPTQFGPNEDLAKYPRDEAGDHQKLEAAGCDVLFRPTASMMYPEGDRSFVEVTKVSEGLCGAHRPGHFRGVTTVVLKLFSIVRPEVAVFGEKDYQQLTVLKTMARDLNLDVEVVGAPLVREPDGLAMSSRNVYLTDEDRTRALGLSRGLFAARDAYQTGARDANALLAAARAELDAVQVAPEYLELRHAETLAPLSRADDPAVMLVAAKVGSTRLIDNLILARP